MNSKGNILAKYYPTAYAVKTGRPWAVSCERAVKSGEKSWQGELRIPLSELKTDKMDKMVFNAARHQVREGMPEAYYSWTPYLNRSLTAMFHDPDDFGTVIFGKEMEKNLITDSDFILPRRSDNQFGGKWYCSAARPKNTRIDYDPNTFISGFRSICLEAEDGTCALRHDLPDLKPNTKYRISYFVKLEKVQMKAKSSGVVLNIYAGGNRWFPRKWLSGTVPWTYQEGTFTTGSDIGENSYLLLYLMNASGKVWFDRIRLEEVR